MCGCVSFAVSALRWKSFGRPEISFSVPACLLTSLQASLQTILLELQDVKFPIYLSDRPSEHMFD